MSIAPINSSFSFIPGYMPENPGSRLVMGVVDSDKSPHEERWIEVPPDRSLDGRVTLLSRPSSALPSFEDDVDIYEEEIIKPSLPDLPPFPEIPKRLDISMIREIPQELEEDPLFTEHMCPVSGLAIRDPVRDRRHPNHIYERKAINQWLFVNKRSPLNGNEMDSSDLVSHYLLKVQIDEKLRIWAEKQHAGALKKYREVVEKREEEVQVILAKYKLAMSEYEVSLKEREEEEQSRQMPYGAGMGKLPQAVNEISIVEEDEINQTEMPYGADLIIPKRSGSQNINDFEKKRIGQQLLGNLACLDEKSLSTCAKVNGIAMGILAAGVLAFRMGGEIMNSRLSDEVRDAPTIMSCVGSAAISGIGSLFARRAHNEGKIGRPAEYSLQEPARLPHANENCVNIDVEKVLKELRDSEERSRGSS